MTKFIEIDGSRGEGGGQVLRTSLALSLVTGQPVRLRKIRAGRDKTGLLRQHLTCVRAIGEISRSRIEGAAMRSAEVSLLPGEVQHGDYRFAVGTAGSAVLVFQTVIYPLLCAPGRSRLVFEGGTHNRGAPSFDFLQRSFLPLLARMGARIEAKLETAGFYPAGGGRFVVELEGDTRWQPLELLERGPLRSRLARITLSKLPAGVLKRERQLLMRKFALEAEAIEIREPPSPGPGNAMDLELEHENLRVLFTEFGERSVPAQRLVARMAKRVASYEATRAPVEEYLADQLLLPLALAGRGRFRCGEPSLHARTNAEIIREFLPTGPELNGLEAGEWEAGFKDAPRQARH